MSNPTRYIKIHFGVEELLNIAEDYEFDLDKETAEAISLAYFDRFAQRIDDYAYEVKCQLIQEVLEDIKNA